MQSTCKRTCQRLWLSDLLNVTFLVLHSLKMADKQEREREGAGTKCESKPNILKEI